ncbi:MAG: hypothetical protein A2832_00065 [Candidatus Zambryskibacteria bacterium RIFCSPHIGHO2_01_FULL_44_22b]|uniref:Damage-inducible protein J n=2 Tax=Candidatus Zambryskiibacteriota TaxID=1817925 RepID=A0A1G2T0Q7_9BACT|nr:MAG: hypothetical protein A2832_00065 [Candidatus Zambryskibacteria bacterium RIFCSPHIGHO2_01_FULL_44_22b]OHB04946.1 MAG: hypothetical protein A3B16_00030 [Candidatus Zambryskibacteria bacterium RIFCSPLOWO2_01_FULL_45_43]
MAKAILNIKTDPELKKEAQQTAKEAGIPLSIVVNSALRKFIDLRSVTVEAPLIPNAKTAKFLRKALIDIKAGKNLVGPFKSAREMIDYLHR